MCTVTVVRTPHEVCLACNRDEQLSHPIALPPQVSRFGHHQAVLPIDPASGGTWIAASDAGLAFVLLNINPESRRTIPSKGSRSRGTIIPQMLPCDTLASAVTTALSLDASAFGLFRLLLVDGEELAELCSDGSQVHRVQHAPLGEPWLFTSSGLGDHRVEGCRRQLFADLFNRQADSRAMQEAFHRHHWADAPHLSVCMRRMDARTVSQTRITLGRNTVSLRYHPDSPDVPAELTEQVLMRLPGGMS